MDKYQYIVNPITNRKVSVNSRLGKTIIKAYKNNMKGGADSFLPSGTPRFFELLDGPVRRVAAKDSPIPFNWHIEEKILPQTQDVANTIKELLEY